MGRRGVKYFKEKEVKIGFFYFEVILHHLRKNKKGLRISELMVKTKLSYNTISSILKKLTVMNRVSSVRYKVFRGPPVLHYRPTEWKLS